MNRNLIIQRVALLFVILMAHAGCVQKTEYSEAVKQNISKVENNLAGWVRTQDNESYNLEERMKFYNINGLSIAIVNDYKIEWGKGYGLADVSEKRPVTESTLFQAASISKSLNGVGVLKLVQDKKIDLNTDINNYLVTWKFPYDEKSNKKLITVAALLSHTAGLTIHGFPGYAIGDSLPTLPQILDGEKPANTEAVRSLGEPGTDVIYSGGGVTVSQMIVMDVTHQPYDVYMQKNVLDPLSMSGSFFTQPPAKGKNKLLSTGYRIDGKEVPGKYHVYPEQAAAGLWTNPVDLCKYIIETQLSYKGESSKVLTPEMTRIRLTTILQDAALGVFVSTKGDSKYFSHNGGNEGFSCQYIGSLDRGQGVVIMTNSDNSSILEEIVNSVATVYGWKDYYQPVLKNVIEVEESLLEKYVGKYEVEGIVINMKKSGKDLLFNAYGDLFWKVNFTSEVEFFIKEYRGDFRFLNEADGSVTGFSADGFTVKKTE
ncbi:MAG: serine hydrolase [Bacteroidia bacterium]|nr:serine hydrolase [Bacteroidia bacterium]